MSNTPEQIVIKVNGVEITVYSDGSIEKPNRLFKDNRLERQFGGRHGRGYRQIDIGGKMFHVHRLVAKAFLDDYSEDLQVDHRSGNGSDNRPENLRMVTSRQNSRAFNRPTKGASSRFRGVCWHKAAQMWAAQTNVDGKNKHIGLFDDEEEAALAWNAAATEDGYAPEAMNIIN